MAIPKFWVPHVLIYLKTQIRKPHYKRSCFAPPILQFQSINPRLFPFFFFFFFPHCRNCAPKFLIPQNQTQTQTRHRPFADSTIGILSFFSSLVWVYQIYAYMCYIQCVCVCACLRERPWGIVRGSCALMGFVIQNPVFLFCSF